MNKTILVLLLGLLAGGAGGYYYAQRHAQSMPESTAQAPAKRKPLFYRNPMNPAITSPVPARDNMGMDYIPVYADEPDAEAKRKVLFYRNPMNPAITSPVPAKDEMGMDYIPVYADGGGDAGENPGMVRIDPVTIQNIGVRTATAERRTLAKSIRAVGRVDYDEQGLTRLHPKTEGWIEELMIDETGTAVEEDTILLSIYSPQLVSSQQEYLLALSNRQILADSPFEDIRRGAEALLTSARERLRLLDVPEHQIRELEQDRSIKKTLHVHSPFAGIVVNIGAREGQYVTPQKELYLIADLSRVWVYADIYEDDLPWVSEGDTAVMDVTGIPGEVFEGKVAYIYPYLERKSRTIRVRLEFPNPGLRLKPDMYANVSIAADRRVDAVVVPSEAIVRSGDREQIFVDLGGGKFDPREVTVGVSADGLTEIRVGIAEGERVVTSSQFLIDSESKLREATAKMLEAMALPDERTDHAGHEPAEEGSAGHATEARSGTPAPPMDHDRGTMPAQATSHEGHDATAMPPSPPGSSPHDHAGEQGGGARAPEAMGPGS